MVLITTIGLCPWNIAGKKTPSIKTTSLRPFPMNMALPLCLYGRLPVLSKRPHSLLLANLTEKPAFSHSLSSDSIQILIQTCFRPNNTSNLSSFEMFRLNIGSAKGLRMQSIKRELGHSRVPP